jgi:hypothetical protein
VFLIGSAMNFVAAIMALAVLKPMRKRMLAGVSEQRAPAALPQMIVQS